MLLLLLLTNAFVLLPWAGAGRIIGGCEAEAHSRPYMAYLEIKRGKQTTKCGGFLIRPDAVLSAAHCVHKKGWNVLVFPGKTVKVTVTLGAHNISAQEESQQKIPVKRWVIHPKYSHKDGKNDIMLLKLKENAKINENVKCISIAKENECVEEGAECIVPGWGWTSMEGKMSDVLMEVELEVQNDKRCQEISSKYQPESMICVGVENSKKATSPGDSGGPLVCNKKAHGVVSHGYPGHSFPEVFTRISHFEPWINKQLRRFGRKVISCFPFSD